MAARRGVQLPFTYPVLMVGVVDGDTVDVSTVLESYIEEYTIPKVVKVLEDVDYDLGFRITGHRKKTFVQTTSIIEERTEFYEQRIRLYGVNTPERGKPGYKEATDFVKGLLMPATTPEGWTIYAHTIKPAEKYGRWLASIEIDIIIGDLSTSLCPSVAQALIDAKLGKEYFGGTK